ncbi:MAG: cation:proton antiporter, partial [Bacteroidota bacterium]
DLAVIVMVLLVPALGSGAGGESVSGLELAQALGTAALIIAVVLVVARRLLPPLLEIVARTCSPELFLLTIMAICLGTAYLVGLAGVSIALGAFLAGLVVSESRFSEHAMSEIMPLQILFSATFFVSVGLLLDVGYMLANLPLVLGIIATVFVIKLAVTYTALKINGTATPVAAAGALWLAQVGEFSFVLERAGREAGLSPLGMGEDGAQAFIAATVVLMALTPVIAPMSGRLTAKLRERDEGKAEQDPHEVNGEHFADLENHTIIAGYGNAARKLVHVLDGSGIPFVIVTLSPQGATEAEADGLRVLRGDYAKQFILEAVGLQRAKLLVVPDDNPQMAHRVVSVARALSPTTRIVACAPTVADAEHLVESGCDRAIAVQMEAVVGLFDDILRHYQVEPDEILRHEEALRRGTYEALEDEMMGSPAVECELNDECFSTRTITIREGTPASGRSLADLGLDERLLHVIQIDRDGTLLREPQGSETLQPGDSVLMGGHADSFIRSADLFRTSDAPRRGDGLPPLPEQPTQRADWIDTTQTVTLTPKPNVECSHLDHIQEVYPSAQGCEDCLKTGDRWVHLRICMTCGYVGCCDSSPNKHATKHFHETGHPIMKSIEPGERWGWCYVDEVML